MPSAERYRMSNAGTPAEVNLPPTYPRSSHWRARCREIWHGGFGPGAAGKGPEQGTSPAAYRYCTEGLESVVVRSGHPEAFAADIDNVTAVELPTTTQFGLAVDRNLASGDRGFGFTT